MSWLWYFRLIAETLLGVMTLSALALCLALWVNRSQLRDWVVGFEVRSVRFNITVLLVDTVLVLAPLSLLLTFLVNLMEPISLRLFSHVSGGVIAVPLCVLLAVFVGDFVSYWRHRLEHTGWFWKVHIMHHSDRQMNWTTIYRFHPINRLTTVIIDGGALALIGFPWWALAINALVRHYYGAFVHVNLPWTFGRLSWIFVSPAMHRWHHVLEGDGVGKNFATVFSIFDRVFRTYHCPGPCSSSLGVSGVYDRQMLWQFLVPFSSKGHPD